MTYTLTLQAKEQLTHDVYRYRFDKPEGFAFTPGQATELAIDADGWRDEARPFTFTSLPDDPFLEFTIKSYDDHDGVTKQLPQLAEGDTVRIGDAWGAIEDKGPGTFIAGGAGITPFIPILRNRARQGTLQGSTLIFSNKTEDDIILRDEWQNTTGLKVLFLVEEDNDSGLRKGRADKDLLAATIRSFDQTFYVCGPDPMVKAVAESLSDLGAPDQAIVTEDFD